MSTVPISQNCHTKRSTFGRQGLFYGDFSTVSKTQSCHTRSCSHHLCSIHVCCKNKSILSRQGPIYLDFSTVSINQSCQSRSYFHRLCCIYVCCNKGQLWVEKVCVIGILVPFSWPKNVILGLVFIAFVP